jgi:hypothetical protein
MEGTAMHERFKDLETVKAFAMPIAMRHALRVHPSTGIRIPYDPSTQMSVFGGDTANVFGGASDTPGPVHKPSRNPLS